MIWHIARITAVVVMIGVCMLLPYLPGHYDRLSVALSLLAQVFAAVGLVLVPLGLVWLVYEFLRRSTPEPTRPRYDLGYWFGLVSIALSTFVALMLSLAALAGVGTSFSIIVLALWAFVVAQMLVRLKAATSAGSRKFKAAPLYLIVLPVAAAICWLTLLEPAAERSRDRVIAAAAPLISDIERFRAARGHYPLSLLSEWEDYDPGVMGVERFYYEPSGDAYNLIFEHPSIYWGTREFVVYNKLDEQQFTGHNADLLQLSPSDLDRQRGYYSVNDTSRPHWKYFSFD